MEELLNETGLDDYDFYANRTQIKRPDYLVAKYALCGIALFGLVGNLFALVSMVLRKLYSNSPIFVYFIFLTLNDTIKVAVEAGIHISRQWVYKTPLRQSDVTNIHGLSITIGKYFSSAAMASSAWVLIAANGYKCYAMLYPLKVKSTDTRFAFISCVIIAFIAYTYNISLIFTQAIIDVPIPNSSYYYSQIGFVVEHIYYMRVFHLPISLVGYAVIPGICLPIMSIIIMTVVRRNYLNYKRMSESATSAESSTYKAAQKSVLALLPLSIIHIVCSLTFFLMILGLHEKDFGFSIHVIVVVNHSINVYAQMICSDFYRNALLGIKKKK